MKVTVPMLFAICLFVTGSMFAGSGFNDEIGITKTPGLDDSAEDLEGRAGQYEADSSSDSGSYLGMSIEAVGAVVEGLRWTFALPLALQNLGLPGWFALPVATPLQLISYLGVWQIVRGFRIR
jgi:hypothetical protein